jgi:hypothetical protein
MNALSNLGPGLYIEDIAAAPQNASTTSRSWEDGKHGSLLSILCRYSHWIDQYYIHNMRTGSQTTIYHRYP